MEGESSNPCNCLSLISPPPTRSFSMIPGNLSMPITQDVAQSSVQNVLCALTSNFSPPSPLLSGVPPVPSPSKVIPSPSVVVSGVTDKLVSPGVLSMDAVNYLRDSVLNLTDPPINGYELLSVEDALLEFALYEELLARSGSNDNLPKY